MKFSNNLIIIPFVLPWEWSTDYANQTAFYLSKKNLVICYMSGEAFSVKEYLTKKTFPRTIKKHSKNIYLFYPTLWIPFRRLKKIELINEKLNLFFLKIFIFWLRLFNRIQLKILWVFDPITQPQIKRFDKSWKVIYDCVDFFTANTNTPGQNKKIISLEKNLVKMAHLVVGNSTVLIKHLNSYGRNDVPLVPQGFRIESFKKFTNKVPKIKNEGRPLIGFLGAVNHRLDYKLFYKVANKNPQWDFALWGPLLETNLFNKEKLNYYKKLTKLPNVITGKSEKSHVPGIISQFDVGIIPYDPKLDFNKYCHPMKIFEYFYLGKPVVSTNIEELKRFPKFVKISNDINGWENHIRNFLSKTWPKNFQQEEKRLAEKNSWKHKVLSITKHLI